MLVEDEQRINAAYGELHHSLISVFTENEYLSSSNPFYVEAVMRQRIASSLDIPRLTTTVDSLMDCDFASLENTIKSVKAAVEASKKLISELLQSVPTESSTDSASNTGIGDSESSEESADETSSTRSGGDATTVPGESEKTDLSSKSQRRKRSSGSIRRSKRTRQSGDSSDEDELGESQENNSDSGNADIDGTDDEFEDSVENDDAKTQKKVVNV